MPTQQTKRPLRILGSSGSAQDRRRLLAAAVKNHKNDPFDILVGDWMSEANMTFNATKHHKGQGIAYEKTFISALEDVLPEIAEYGIKIAANAGSSDTKGLHDALLALVKEKNVPLKIAWVEGDQVLPAVLKAEAEKTFDFRHLCTNQPLSEWKHEPISAQAYLGGLGIAEAFAQGADIVVCGRVSDASPVIGSAFWWHGWDREDYDQLANSLVAGHLIECSSYVTGGNFTGFKDLEHRGWHNLGLPIAEIDSSGQVIVTKTRGSNGLVSINTCKSQLLYEIQGPRYYNSDVTAYIDGVKFEETGPDRVLLSGIHGGPPPATTKVGITAKEAYHAEMIFWLVGLDIEAKARMLKAQIREELGHRVKNLSSLEFTLNGVAAEDPQDQPSATVCFRVVAQASEKVHLEPANFLEPILETTMELYPGGTFHMDVRTALPRETHEYFVTKLPQSLINHRIHLHDGRTIDIAPPSAVEREIAVPSKPSPRVDVGSFGATTRGPLGWIVHSRSGDKGSNANVGFYVCHDDEYEWLCALLTVEKIQKLLAKEYNGGRIERFELPNIGAVHFLLYDHLDRGVSCTKTLDFLGKNVGEYLRSKFVDIPVAFLERGEI
ncbi:uncharacterized protein N7479_011234 [Penicillium vulpinum]|uniref:DUF1446-domain-containing protein n=1 Tax=Penicillium vulpinum TaxID=29845 RepID=A0A1V6RRZ9_9EURO|nr:uncharacterized protein N7479_011234 [Penicillium vulpinum]KAJ5952821.1 hypothetical protein N7479_011234 [Penicillium vulpinum]OQE04406.1 hypothetical protein PENVUL_c033G09534 [Penicillium vulpinum]